MTFSWMIRLDPKIPINHLLNIYWDFCHINFKDFLCLPTTSEERVHFIVKQQFVACIFHKLFKLLPVNGHLDHFQYLAITNKAAMNMHAEASVCTYAWVTRPEVAASHSRHVYHLKKLPNCSPKYLCILHPPSFLHPYQDSIWT